MVFISNCNIKIHWPKTVIRHNIKQYQHEAVFIRNSIGQECSEKYMFLLGILSFITTHYSNDCKLVAALAEES